MATIVKDLGAVTAYAYAKEKGYTGTEDEFAELMASYADVAEQAAESAAQAGASAEAAEQAKAEAVLSASAAASSASTASTKASEAAQSASSASGSANTATTKANEASTSATNAASSASAAATSATNAGASATAAASSATAASNAQTAAETAQGKAEDAQTAAEDAAEQAGIYAAGYLKAFPVDTASGSIASFPDGADSIPVKDLTVAIEPVQDLHGYDNPWPAGGGKNLFDASKYGTRTTSGVTCTNNGNGSFTLNGTATVNVYFDIFTSQFNTGSGGTPLPSAQYRLTGCPQGGSQDTYSLYTFPSYLNDLGSGATFTGQVQGGSIYVASGYTCNNLVFWPMLRLASNGDDTFAPYSNICPISGWAGCEVYRTGKNLIPDIKYQFNSQNVFLGASSNSRNLHLVPGSYTMKIYGAATGILVFSSYVNSMPTQTFGNQNVYMITIPAESNYNFWLYNSNGISASDITHFQLEIGSTATDYEEYRGDAYSITFPASAGTVYGGTLDVTTGKLTVDRMIVDLGMLPCSRISTKVSGVYRFIFNGVTGLKWSASLSSKANLLCSQYPTETVNGTYLGRTGIAASADADNVYVFDSTRATLSAKDFSAAMSGTKLCYELATPIVYDLTPAEVRTLLAQNNIWADCGDSTVEYRADTKLYIDKKIAALAAAMN